MYKKKITDKSLKSLRKKVLNAIESKIIKPTPGLLLNYTYSLNTACSKTVSTGFDIDNFESVLLIKDVLNGYLTLNALEWYSVFVKFGKINDIIQRFIETDNTDKTKSNIILSKTLFIQVVKEENGLIKVFIQKTGADQKYIINLDYTEYIALYGLSEFIHLVITFNRTASPHLSAYFNLYVKKCMELDSWTLDSQHYFTPSNFNNFDSINYSRLFYELSFLCGDKIVKAIDALKKVYI